MSSNVSVAEATRDEAGLPERVQAALGQLVEAAKEGLLALNVGVGPGVLTELMEEEVVRHEALSDRAGCETSSAGCPSSPEKLRAIRARSGGRGREAALTKTGRVGHYRTVRARRARQRGVAKANQWSNPLGTPRSSNPMDIGCRSGAR